MEWGRALGYGGTPNSVRSVISRLESGSRLVPAVVGLLAWMYGRYGIPGDGIPLDGNRRDGGPPLREPEKRGGDLAHCSAIDRGAYGSLAEVAKKRNRAFRGLVHNGRTWIFADRHRFLALDSWGG